MTLGEDAAVDIKIPDGKIRSYILETDEKLLSLRSENIELVHPLAEAMQGKEVGDTFDWPFDGGGTAKILSIKHKALHAFHFVVERFEEKFPHAQGFKSVKFNPEKEDAFADLKAMLRERAEYAQQMARSYNDGEYPVAILAQNLGLDQIDAVLGLKSECGYSLKVSSCYPAERERADDALKIASASGILADPTAIYLLRRLDLAETVAATFGKIGVTQNTIDIFTERAARETSPGGDDASSKSISIKADRLQLHEIGAEQVAAVTETSKADLRWIWTSCHLVPTVGKSDPPDALIRFQSEPGGKFIDDLIACEGSGRVLISDDYHLRQWGESLFNVPSVWIQSLLFDLEEAGTLSVPQVITATIRLLEIGEAALSINCNRLLAGAEMYQQGQLTKAEISTLFGVLGQPMAEMNSHTAIAHGLVYGLWRDSKFSDVRELLTSYVLLMLTRHQGTKSASVIATFRSVPGPPRMHRYINGWRLGHFI